MPFDTTGRTQGGEGGILYGSYTKSPAQVWDSMTGYQNQQKLAGIQADAAKYPATLQQDRFNQIFPFLKGQMGGLGGEGSNNPYTIGGHSPASPEITVGPVLNNQQIQGQVNAQRAATDRSTATQIRDQQQSAAGRGVGANSPLSQALAGQAQSAGLATNVGNERQTRLDAAKMNAGQILNTQQARESQFATRQQEEIARAAPYFQQRATLLSALAGLV